MLRLGFNSNRFHAGWLGLSLGLVAGLLITAPPASGVAGYGDVAEGRYYTDAVQWSVDNDISGISGGCFLPDLPVSRGEAAVYIWNVEGQPAAPEHSFVDVAEEGQHAAVSWMSHSGITTGTSDTTFAPDTTLTRAHLVTFLHRLAGKPEAPAHPFVDVYAPWQQDSASWAAHSGITTGTSPTTFSPDDPLTRAHLVTFLYRYKGQPAVSVDPRRETCEAISAIDAGRWHSCALRTDSTITCWGITGDAAADPSITNAIQAVYVVPSDQTPYQGQEAAIAHEIGEVQSWFDTQTGGKHPIFVRDGDSFSVVTVNLSGPIEEFTSITPILAEIRAAVPAVFGHALAIYIEGEFNPRETRSCGWARAREVVIPIGNCDIRPANGSAWPYAGTYLLAHELAHVLGAVPSCAPNEDGTSHVSDDNRDLLYNGPEGRDWANLMLDPGNDDYYMHGRDDCFDIADSPLLGSD